MCVCMCAYKYFNDNNLEQISVEQAQCQMPMMTNRKQKQTETETETEFMACSQWRLDWSANGRRVRALNLLFNLPQKQLQQANDKLFSMWTWIWMWDRRVRLALRSYRAKWTVTSLIFQCDYCECESDCEVRMRPCDLIAERTERERGERECS